MPNKNVATDAKVKEVENEVANGSLAEDAGSTAPVAKRKGRGVASSRGTSLKKYHEIDACATNMLFTGFLSEVKLEHIVIGEDTTGMPSFTGMTLPKVVLHFQSPQKEVNERRHAFLQFTPSESNADSIPGGKNEWRINNMFDYFKHILDVYVLKGRDLTDEEAAALELPFEDFDEDGNYVPVPTEQVVAGWEQLFTNFVNILNGAATGKPVYKTATGSSIIVWMKLLRFTQYKGNWRPVVSGNNAGDLGFPIFVGEGVIEIFNQNKPANLKIDLTKESIRPKEVSKAPTKMPAGAAAMGGVGMSPNMMGMGDMQSGASMGGDGFGVDGANEDLPF